MAFDHWFNIAGVDVSASAGAAVIVALGDSITDGHGSTTNGNDRWPDDLVRRLWAAMPTRPFGVLNEGMGAIVCCSTDWERTRWRASIAMSWPRRASAM